MDKKRKKKMGYKQWAVVVLATAVLGGQVWMNLSDEHAVQVEATEDVQTSFYQPVKTEKASREEKMEIPLHEKATKGQRLKRKGYALSYDAENRTPQWVAWELTRKETKGRVERTDWFEADKDVKGTQVQYEDYSGSGYDRGHMAPAGDMKWDVEAMEQSFLMSNICPQNHALNKGSWNDLEEETREWAEKYGKAYVVCGPIYENGKKVKRIGKNKVAVPHGFYKVVLVYPDKKPLAMGFLFNNDDSYQPMEKALVSVDRVEKLTGLDFFSLLPDSEEQALEAVTASLP